MRKFFIVKNEDGREKFIQKDSEEQVISFLAEVATGEIPIKVVRIFSVDTLAHVNFYKLMFENFKFSLIVEDVQ